MEYKESGSRSINSMKNVIISLQNYKEDKSETSLSDTLHHIEILLAVFSNTLGEVQVCFGKSNGVGAECISLLVNSFSWHYVDQHLMRKILQLILVVAQVPDTCQQLFSCSLSEHLAQMIVKNQDNETNMLTMLELFEELSSNEEMTLPGIYHDDILQFLIQQITADKDADFTLSCLGCLRNLISKSMPMQVKCKATISNSQLKIMVNFLRGECYHRKILMLSVILNAFYGERQFDSCFKDKNLYLTMVMIFSMLSKSDNVKGQCAAAELCVDLLRREKIRNEIEIFFTENKNYIPKFVLFLKHDISPVALSKMMIMLLELSHVPAIRREMCASLMNPKKACWQVIINHANGNINASYHSYDNQVILTTLQLIKELTEEKAESVTEASNKSWFLELNEMISNHLNETTNDQMNQAIVLKRNLECMKILTCLCQEEYLMPCIIDNISIDGLQKILEHQLSCNLSGIKKQKSLPEWSVIGAELVLEILDFLHKLKSKDSSIDTLLYGVLQDKRTMPLLGKAITSDKQSKVLLVIQLIQESAALPDFPCILLGQKILEINLSHNHDNYAVSCASDMFDRLSVNDSVGFNDIKELEKPAWQRFKTHSDHDIDVVSVSSSSTDKENILTESNNNNKVTKRTLISTDSKMSEIMEMYQQQLAAHNLKESHLQDLLETKTYAVAHADRLILDFKYQLKQSKEQIMIMQKMLQESENKIDENEKRITSLEAERKEIEDSLEEAVFVNNTLEEKINQCSEFENKYQEQIKEFEGLSRTHSILKREFESMKDLYNEQKKKCEELDAERDDLSEQNVKLNENNAELEKRLQELHIAIDEQNEIAEKLLEDKIENEKSIKDLKTNVTKLEKAKHELVIKMTGLEQSRQKESKKLSMTIQCHENTIQKLEQDKVKLNQQIEELNDKVTSQGEMLTKISSMFQAKS